MQDHKITLFHANWSFCSQMVRVALFELNIKGIDLDKALKNHVKNIIKR